MPFKSKVDWKEEISNVIEMGKEGATYQEIGDKYGVTRERIRQVIRQYVPNWQEIYGMGGRKAVKLEKYRKKWGTTRKVGDDLYDAQRSKFRYKKANAKHKGWTWELDFGDLEWPTHCPVLGMELDYFAETRQENSVSFDQIDAGKGYVKGNVRLMSWRANRIKNDGSAEEHRLIANYLESL